MTPSTESIQKVKTFVEEEMPIGGEWRNKHTCFVIKNIGLLLLQNGLTDDETIAILDEFYSEIISDIMT